MKVLSHQKDVFSDITLAVHIKLHPYVTIKAYTGAIDVTASWISTRFAVFCPPIVQFNL